MLASLLAISNLGVVCFASTPDSSPLILKQVSDLQFTEDMVTISVEQGGSNTGSIRIQNYGGQSGSANITFQGSEPDGITVELSATSITNLHGGAHRDITVTVSAEAGLWPLGPRRLDLGLVNSTWELDSMYIEMDVVAPAESDGTPVGFFGIPIETIVLSIAATAIVVIVVVILRRK